MAMSNFDRCGWLACGILCLFATAAVHAAIPGSERQVLLNLYASANGSAWANHANWNGPAGTECNWFGVSCDGAKSHVVDVQLAGNNLSGSLPSLSPLTNLQTFDVSDNQLAGTIPPLSSLSNLQNFYAFQNHLTGGIPAIAGLTQLGYFYVYNNGLTGSIPDLSNMPTLCHINLSRNNLSGAIPSLTQLSALVLFNVSGNALSGNIPDLTGLSNLTFLNVGGNQLTGAVPAATGLNSLMAGGSGFCPNSLTMTDSTAWDNATGHSPWWAVPYSTNRCDDVFANGFE